MGNVVPTAIGFLPVSLKHKLTNFLLGGKEKTEEEKEDEGNCVNGVHAPQIIIPLVLEQYLEGIAKTGE